MNRLTLCARNHNHHHTDFNTWASSWSSDQGKLKYYDDSSAVAKAQLVNYNIDFGVSGDALGRWLGPADRRRRPATARGASFGARYAHAFPKRTQLTRKTAHLHETHLYFSLVAYNIPKLVTAGYNLVLDAKVVALIYLNNITMWSDQRIKDINEPVVAALLPARPIVVITENHTSINTIFTKWLSELVPGWSTDVRQALLDHHTTPPSADSVRLTRSRVSCRSAWAGMSLSP
jgi:hypothetical protein